VEAAEVTLAVLVTLLRKSKRY